MLPSSDPKFRGADPSDAEKYVQLLAEIKTALDGKELSISVPSRPLDRRLYTADVAQGIDSLVDWWNVMTYDYVNRRDTQTNFHSGGVVVADTLAYYSGFGIKTSRMVIGFALYAKWFILNGADSASCSASKPIGCRMGGYEDSTGADDGQSGSWTFNQQLNPTTNATVAASYQSIPSSGTNISDPKQMSSAFYDSAHHIFWTWASPDDIKKTCQTYKDQVAGVGLWSLNQDIDAASGGDHIKAVADCMAS